MQQIRKPPVRADCHDCNTNASIETLLPFPERRKCGHHADLSYGVAYGVAGLSATFLGIK